MIKKANTFYKEHDIVLYRGDCFELIPLITEKEKINIVITDPPYELVKGGGWKENGVIKPYLQEIYKIDVSKFNPVKLLSILPTKNGIFFCNKLLISNYIEYAKKNNLLFDVHVMIKSNPIPAKSTTFIQDLEYIIYIKEKGSYFNNKSFFNDYRKTFNVNCKGNNLHPNQKEIAIIEKYLRVLTKEGDLVLDPFIGSGTTAVACKNLNRRFIGIEKEEKYLNIAVDRLRQEVFNF